jgi:hypothetical protein
MRLTTSHHKNYYCYETQNKPQNRDYFTKMARRETMDMRIWSILLAQKTGRPMARWREEVGKDARMV